MGTKQEPAACIDPHATLHPPVVFLPRWASFQLAVLFLDFVEALQSRAHEPKVELYTCVVIGRIFIDVVFCFFSFLAHLSIKFSGIEEK